MNLTIAPKIESLLQNLDKSQLVGIDLDSNNLGVRLEFTFGPEKRDIIVQLFQLVHFIISKEPDDNDGCFFVGEVALNPLKDGGKKILSSLLYPLQEKNGNVASYPAKQMFHFHLEGGVCIEAVCGAYEIFQQVENS